VHGIDLRGETSRLWAHEHQSRWRLRLSRPALDTMADTPELGRALAEFAAACARMAQPSGPAATAAAPDMDDAVPAFLGRAAKAEAARAPIRVDTDNDDGPPPEEAPSPHDKPSATTPAPAAVPASRSASSSSPLQPEETVMELERRLGLRGPES
jgi:hypothetical protein